MILNPGSEPIIDVGLLLASSIRIELNGVFNFLGEPNSGTHIFSIRNNQIYQNDLSLGDSEAEYLIQPLSNATFTVHNVVYGIGFHWEREENMTFTGAIVLKLLQGKIQLINRVSLEDYLKSVIASEMSSTASMALLKAHAVMSRSWLIAQLQTSGKQTKPEQNSSLELIRWYDREDHCEFDVCADDHCQRYQGITRISNPNAIRAIDNTRGLVLLSDGEVCDARFSKCCGGISEVFGACWEDVSINYLKPVCDDKKNSLGNVSHNDDAKVFIESSPKAFCNSSNKEVLAQVLNEYDLETKDFFRWEEELSASKIKSLLDDKLDLHLGEIRDLIPLTRGASGRIIRLKIVGSEREMIIGKELEIRKALSHSHLFSSAFIVDKRIDDSGSLWFKLKGAGWGHGVGLCQIGAAVMGEKGYDYREILNHYFKNTSIETIY